MARIDIESEIALALRSRLISKISDHARQSNVWIDDAPLPFGKDPPPFRENFSIMINDGQFPEDWGGAHCALQEHTGFIVTHMLKREIDPSKQLTQIIAESEGSMLAIKRAILSAFLVERVSETSSAKTPWRPKSASGSYMWDMIRPSNYVSPKRHQDWPLLYQCVEFKFAFFWDL